MHWSEPRALRGLLRWLYVSARVQLDDQTAPETQRHDRATPTHEPLTQRCEQLQIHPPSSNGLADCPPTAVDLPGLAR
eukprot:1439224-Amphidinium_carterae.1